MAYPAIVAIGVATMALLSGAFDGSVKGDDAFFHMSNARFLAENFPSIWWQPASHSGEPGLLSYPLPYYGILALLDRLSVDLSTGLRLTILFSLPAFGVATYWIARRFQIDRLTSAGLGLMLATGPMVWNWALVGGAYVRIAALPFTCLSLGFAYRRVNDESRSHKTLLHLILILGGAALMHPLLFQFTFALSATIIFLGTPGWVARVSELLKVGLGVTAIAAWQYLPLIGQAFGQENSITGATPHDTTPIEGGWLFAFPQPNEWSITVGPALVIVGVLVIVLVAANLRRLRVLRSQRRADWAFLIAMLGWSIYFGVLAWFDVPDALYLMAAYDHVLWLSITLTMAAVATIAFAQRTWPSTLATIGRPLLVLVVSLALATVPWLRSFVSNSDPDVSTTYANGAKKVVDVALKRHSTDFRLGMAHRTFTRWLSWKYPNLQFVGGRSSISLNRYYYEWMLFDLFFRTDGEELRSTYFEDRPKVLRYPLDDPQNAYSALFFQDWFGLDQIALTEPFVPMRFVSELYGSRPQFFTTRNVPTRFGRMGLATPREKQPIAVTSTAPLVGVPYVDEGGSARYQALLELLSALDLGPGIVIPVQVQGDENLSALDIAITDAETFSRNQSRLTEFAERGGRLIVERDVEPANRPRDVVTAAGVGLRLPVTKIERPDSVFASVGDEPLGGCSPSGRGAICEIGTTLTSLSASGDVAVTLLLLDILDLESKVSREVVDVGSLGVTYSTPETRAQFSQVDLSELPTTQALSGWKVSFSGPGDAGTVAPKDVLSSRFRPPGPDQVNYSSELRTPIPPAAASSLRLTIDSERARQVEIAYVSEDRFVASGLTLRRGTHDYVLPGPSGDGSDELGPVDSVVISDKPAAPTRTGGRLRVVDARIRYWDRGGDGFLQVAIDREVSHNQVNVGSDLLTPIPIDGRAMIRFRLYNDGATLRNFAVVAGGGDQQPFMERAFPEAMTWRGWKRFSIPVASFRQKIAAWPREIKTVDVIWNFDRPYGARESYSFGLRDLESVLVESRGRSRQVRGDWVSPTLFETVLTEPGSTFVWKESFTPSWEARAGGRRLVHLMAGPGMTAVLSDEAGPVAISQPPPSSLVMGFSTSLLSGIILITWFALSRRRRSERERKMTSARQMWRSRDD